VVDGELVDDRRTLVHMRASSCSVRSCWFVPFCPVFTMAAITTVIVVVLVLVEDHVDRRAMSS